MEALGFLRLSPKYPEQGFGMGSDQGASFQIWEETQPQGPGGHCWLKGPGAQRGCPRGWSMPSFLLRHPAALGLGTHPSHPLVTVLVSWGQSRSQPCRQAGGGGVEGGWSSPAPRALECLTVEEAREGRVVSRPAFPTPGPHRSWSRRRDPPAGPPQLPTPTAGASISSYRKQDNTRPGLRGLR